ncbi:cbb3-type cytochrome oxidase assembly protein CcoS [Alkalilimnicola sp. S0819]|uniref:cbb3-type cytochrome oxidase assembly protein CcoS n=1 Tax=Alkalilimnicola sp. S0819 TaxID=2613922 RepID=UPI0012615AA0|nr:cbb3-type cytochrome oxidase assembly protein CcoS [Alkalilimnicola sp. S0819]KAB7628195.1 cbb3-type cytochrome oxidase assembly protein CcoS [Alkalilimnicola sp. S0819]MPQ15084.1 cbb3-type cytochrome oxidase assembly protein CcoS [Alkalilimnicola sp. S0819]
MNIILVLIPLGIMLLGVAIWAFFWAVNNGQFDDLDSPAYRILMEDKAPAPGRGQQDDSEPGATPEDGEQGGDDAL